MGRLDDHGRRRSGRHDAAGERGRILSEGRRRWSRRIGTGRVDDVTIAVTAKAPARPPWTNGALVWVWYATFVGLAAWGLYSALAASAWDGFDLGIYLEAAGRWPTPYDCPPTGSCYRYSPGFALLTTPLTLVPFEVALAAWRIAGVACLALALARLHPAVVLGVILSPWVIADLSVGNTTTFALAAMVAVLRWPSVRTAVLYAALVALVPKPSFLPVLALVLWQHAETRRPVAVVGAFGAAMLLWPGYIAALGTADRIMGGTSASDGIPAAMTAVLVASGLACLVLATRWPRLVGPASVLVSAYWYPYTFAVGLTAFIAPPPLQSGEGRCAVPDRPSGIPRSAAVQAGGLVEVQDGGVAPNAGPSGRRDGRPAPVPDPNTRGTPLGGVPVEKA
jgi:hypothetical protein